MYTNKDQKTFKSQNKSQKEKNTHQKGLVLAGWDGQMSQKIVRVGKSMLSEINYCGHVIRLAHFTSIGSSWKN